MPPEDLNVRLRSDSASYEFGEPLRLRYEVENRAANDLYVVRGEPLAQANSSSELEVLVGEAPRPPELVHFSYEAPALSRLAPGARRRFRLSLALPLIESVLSPDGVVEQQEVGVAGDVEVILRVGFLQRPFRPTSAAPWAEFAAAQELSAPVSIRVQVAPAGP